MKMRFEQRYLIAMIFGVICCLGFSVSAAQAQMTSKEILQKADEARGNAEGIQWEIVIDSVEGGREQHRTLRVNARGYNSLADTLAPANVKGQKLLMQDRNMWFAKPGLSKAVPISRGKSLWAVRLMAILLPLTIPVITKSPTQRRAK